MLVRMKIIYYEEHVRSARNLIYCDITESDIREENGFGDKRHNAKRHDMSHKD